MRILKEMGVSHFDRLTYQMQKKGVGRLFRELTGKIDSVSFF